MKFRGLSEIKSRRGRRRLILIFAGIFFGTLFVLWLFSVPEDLFRGVPYSTVVLDKNGELLGARVADDGQWRFPLADSLPEKYIHALIEFEDRNFRHHIGVSFRAILRALVQNIESGEVVSGASTITMQVARMARKRDRTLWQKLIECFWATRIEARYTKDEILRIYASHAPFGGNVVGIDAAMWSYMGRGGSDLSWAEAATLAILPNAPSSVTPVKGRTELLKEKKQTFKEAFPKGLISEFDLEMAMEEPLIGVPQPLPQHAYHLVEKYDRKYHGKKCHTDVWLSLQRRSADMCQRWSREFSQRGIKDMGAVIIEVSSGEVISYVGNSDMERSREGRYVDVADSPRSSGSILKPFLYAGALQDGIVLPHTLLPDVPINIGGFAPENFDKSYAGAVSASEALASSLNVPMVILLKQYGVRQFYDDLVSCRLSTLRRDPDAYGLSLILGGAECSLLEISESYAQMAGRYLYGGRGESEISLFHGWEEFPFRDATALYYTFEAMAEVNRPDQMDWREVPSLIKCAWKTGTSYGSRDAWAVGVTPDYVVGVWVGNADGSGVSGLTGACTAGPVMFDLLSLLPRGESGYRWFPSPEELGYRVVTASVCPESGCLAGENCGVEGVADLIVPEMGLDSKRCPYHHTLHVSADGRYRIEDRSVSTTPVKYFILPPSMEYYYRRHHPEYKSIPPLPPAGYNSEQYETMRFLFPQQGALLYAPRNADGSMGGVVFDLAHSDPGAVVYWHLDKEYIGETTHIHTMRLTPSSGRHTLTVVDQWGNSCDLRFDYL